MIDDAGMGILNFARLVIRTFDGGPVVVAAAVAVVVVAVAVDEAP